MFCSNLLQNCGFPSNSKKTGFNGLNYWKLQPVKNEHFPKLLLASNFRSSNNLSLILKIFYCIAYLLVLSTNKHHFDEIRLSQNQNDSSLFGVLFRFSYIRIFITSLCPSLSVSYFYLFSCLVGANIIVCRYES